MTWTPERLQTATRGRACVRAVVKSVLLGAAGMQLVVRAPASVWEWSDAPALTSLLMDGAWALLLGGLPALIGWPPRRAWRGAAITLSTTVAASGLWLALRPPGSADDQAALVLRVVRLGAEGVIVTGALALTGAWLAIPPPR